MKVLAHWHLPSLAPGNTGLPWEEAQASLLEEERPQRQNEPATPAAVSKCGFYYNSGMVVRLRLVENCHRKESFLFKVPKRRGHTMPQGDHKGSASVGQETEGAGDNMGRGLYCGFHG